MNKKPSAAPKGPQLGKLPRPVAESVEAPVKVKIPALFATPSFEVQLGKDDRSLI